MMEANATVKCTNNESTKLSKLRIVLNDILPKYNLSHVKFLFDAIIEIRTTRNMKFLYLFIGFKIFQIIRLSFIIFYPMTVIEKFAWFDFPFLFDIPTVANQIYMIIYLMELDFSWTIYHNENNSLDLLMYYFIKYNKVDFLLNERYKNKHVGDYILHDLVMIVRFSGLFNLSLRKFF